MAEDYLLTTVDNPFNPHHHFNEWYAWDAHAGYHTPGYLARIAHVSPDLAEADYMRAVDDAIDEIIKENPYGVHCKIAATDAAPRTPNVSVA